MDSLIIEGQVTLKGEISISGAKNAALPILAATLLTDDCCAIKNIPILKDTLTMIKILRSLGVEASLKGNSAYIQAKRLKSHSAPYKFVSTMRASFCILGPLLARLKEAKVSLPGGCLIGSRPVDLHLKGLGLLGAKIEIDSGYVVAKAPNLKGASIYLGGIFGSSVLATANVMMAATLAKGKTVIENAACEPEIVDLANFLIKMGAKIKGYGTPYIEIEGVKRLHGAEHCVIPDRIEAGTFMLAAAITSGNILIRNVIARHSGALIDKLKESGVNIREGKNHIKVSVRRKLRSVNVTTLPFPGFPTDMQAQMMAFMSVTPGISVITEKIFPDRFIHVAELNRMGAHIIKEGPQAIIEGVKCLEAAPVMASDLRASACLVLAGLAARGKTRLSRIYHLERGYENLCSKFQKLGAGIHKEKDKK